MAAGRADGRTSCRFYVEVGDVKQAVFSEVSGLSMEMTLDDIEEGGHNNFVHRLPGRCKVGNLVLKRGITTSNEFFKWCIDVAKGTVKKQHISVILYNLNGTEAMRWNFDNAFPVKWSGPQFKADDTSVAIETVELAHDGMKLG